MISFLVVISSCKIASRDQKVQHVLNVMDFGAAGDGVTYDGPAIQKAIDSAAVLKNNTQVFIPGGHRYLFAVEFLLRVWRSVKRSGASSYIIGAVSKLFLTFLEDSPITETKRFL